MTCTDKNERKGCEKLDRRREARREKREERRAERRERRERREKREGKREKGKGRREMGDGRWEMGDGRWEMGDGGYGPSSVNFTEFPLHVGEFEADVLHVFLWKGFRGAHEDLTCMCDSKELSGSADVQ